MGSILAAVYYRQLIAYISYALDCNRVIQHVDCIINDSALKILYFRKVKIFILYRDRGNLYPINLAESDFYFVYLSF